MEEEITYLRDFCVCVDFKKRASDLPKPAVVLIGEENNESPLATGELKLNLSCNKKDTC
jgi:hypothetical protein